MKGTNSRYLVLPPCEYHRLGRHAHIAQVSRVGAPIPGSERVLGGRFDANALGGHRLECGVAERASTMSDGEKPLDGLRQQARLGAKRINALDDGTRILIYVVLSLTVVGAIILGIRFWDTITTVTLWTGGALCVVGVVGVVAIATIRMKRARRERAQAQERKAAEAQVRRERAQALRIQAILDGESKPIADTGGLFLRNSEFGWHRCSAVMGSRGGPIQGELLVTSMRVVFVSSKPLEIAIGNINAANAEAHTVHVVGKTSNHTASFQVNEPEIVKAHIERSVLAYHRQVDVGFEQGGNRAIPQDVKTAVYQRDGGKCVECGAADYLEFDHVIPFSRGGASSVENLQLLCRRCNQSKRDRI